MERVCGIAGCNASVKAKGFCRRHYNQWWKRNQGQVSGPMQLTTIRTPNTIVNCGGYSEVILRNAAGEEVARAKIDNEDAERVSRHKWRLHSSGYAYGGSGRDTRFMMHRLVLDIPLYPGEKRAQEVDHINRDKLDNRRENLMVVPLWVNQTNRHGQEGKLRIGVRYEAECSRRPWVAHQRTSGHTRYAYFGTYEDAVKQREAWEIEWAKTIEGEGA